MFLDSRSASTFSLPGTCAADNQTPFSIQKSQICFVIMLQSFKWLVPILFYFLTQATAVVLSIIILTWWHGKGNSDCNPNNPALSSSMLMLMPVSVSSQWPPVCPRSHEAPYPNKDASEKNDEIRLPMPTLSINVIASKFPLLILALQFYHFPYSYTIMDRILHLGSLQRFALWTWRGSKWNRSST